MQKIIVLSGHGSWEMKDGYTALPAKCSIKFYTLNSKTLSDGLGGDIDRGMVANLTPDQEGGPYSTVPNMRLYPPTGLNIRTPASSWEVIELPAAVNNKNKNLQIKIRPSQSNGMDLASILRDLAPAISGEGAIILWAACRAIGLNGTGAGAAIGMNKMQR